MAFSVLGSFHREGFFLITLHLRERREERKGEHSTGQKQFCKFMFQLRHSEAAASTPNITNNIKTATEPAPGLMYIKSQ